MNNKLKEVREVFGLTMKELGDELGVTSNAVNQWEKGKVTLTDERIEQLCIFYQLPEEILFKIEEFTQEEMFEIEKARFLQRMNKYYNNEFLKKVAFEAQFDALEEIDSLETFIERALQLKHDPELFDSIFEYFNTVLDIMRTYEDEDILDLISDTTEITKFVIEEFDDDDFEAYHEDIEKEKNPKKIKIFVLKKMIAGLIKEFQKTKYEREE